MIDIKLFAKQKDISNNPVAQNTGGYGGANNIATSIDGHLLWGQYFNGTQDITGDLISNGKITCNSLDSNNITTFQTLISNGVLTVNGQANFNNGISVQAVSTNDNTIEHILNINTNGIYLTSGNEIVMNSGSISLGNNNGSITLNGQSLDIYNNYTNIHGRLNVTGDSTFDNITTNKLEVLGTAHFFELIIDKVKSTQGQIIITAANAHIVQVDDISEGHGSRYKCYFLAQDGDKKITNNFEVNDHIICQTFNAATGTQYDVSNKFYWCNCEGVGDETIMWNGENTPMHYIILDLTDGSRDNNGVPEAGDDIVQLGNYTNEDRQAAIIISAYNNPYLDPDIEAPAIVQYDGIDDFEVETHRLNVISKGLNSFKGNFSTTAGDDVAKFLSDLNNSISDINSDVFDLTNSVSQLTVTTNGISGRVTTIENNYVTNSTFTQTTNAISGRVSTIEGDYVTNSTLTQTANSIKTEVEGYTDTQIENLDLSDELTVTVDALNLNENTFYPVVIHFIGDGDSNKEDPTVFGSAPGYQGTEMIKCRVQRTLDSTYGVPSYASHAAGFCVDLEWLTKSSAWGTNTIDTVWSTNDKVRYINEFKTNWTEDIQQGVHVGNFSVAGSIGQVIPNSSEVVYVRGGSKYDVSTSHKNSIIRLYPNGFTWNPNGENGISSETKPIITNVTDLVLPVKDMIGKSEIVQTAQNIELNVYNRFNEVTGINIETGEINLNADNTHINGNLKIHNADEGLVVYDQNNIQKIAIQNNALGNFSNYSFGTQSNHTFTLTGTKNANSSRSILLTTNDIDLGTLQAGSYVVSKDNTIDKTIYTQFYNTPQSGRFINEVDITYILKDANDNVIDTDSYTVTIGTNEDLYEYLDDYSYQIQTTGQYKLCVTVEYIFNEWSYDDSSYGPYWFTPNEPPAGGMWINSPYIYYYDRQHRNLYWTGTKDSSNGNYEYRAFHILPNELEFTNNISINIEQTTRGYNRIANDGAIFASDSTQYNWFGNDFTQFRQGKSILKIVDDNIYRCARMTGGSTQSDATLLSSFSDISSTIPVKNVRNSDLIWRREDTGKKDDLGHIIYVAGNMYDATPNDGLIFVSSKWISNITGTIYIVLPDPATMPGKVYHIKQCVDNDIRIKTYDNSKTILDGNNDFGWYTLNDLDGSMYRVISTGDYWLLFY